MIGIAKLVFIFGMCTKHPDVRMALEKMTYLKFTSVQQYWRAMMTSSMLIIYDVICTSVLYLYECKLMWQRQNKIRYKIENSHNFFPCFLNLFSPVCETKETLILLHVWDYEDASTGWIPIR